MKQGCIKRMTLGMLVMVFLAMVVGCATVPHGIGNVYPDSLGALKEGQARIVYTRMRETYGAAPPHFVIDTGTGIEKNATLVQKIEAPAGEGDLSKARNVKYLDCTIQQRGAPVLYRLVGKQKPAELDANATFIGTSGSGRSLAWNRTPGKMRLQVITPAGDQAFAAPIDVRAGKTYRVKYWYMKALFEVTTK